MSAWISYDGTGRDIVPPLPASEASIVLQVAGPIVVLPLLGYLCLSFGAYRQRVRHPTFGGWLSFVCTCYGTLRSDGPDGRVRNSIELERDGWKDIEMRAADTMPHGLTSDISRIQAARVQHPILAAGRSAAANADAPLRSALANDDPPTERQQRTVRFVSLLDSGASDLAPPPAAPSTRPPAFDPALVPLPELPSPIVQPDAALLAGPGTLAEPVLTPTVTISSPASTYRVNDHA